jgi:Cu+-exporting ATPase
MGGLAVPRGRAPLRSGHLNMFTLIALAVGAAYLFSIAMLAPGWFRGAGRHGDAHLFRGGAVITVLCPGTVLEAAPAAGQGRHPRAPPGAGHGAGRRRYPSATSRSIKSPPAPSSACPWEKAGGRTSRPLAGR